jgi:Na+/proline symporter
MDVAARSQKLELFDFRFSLFTTYNFWGGLLGGMFLTTASHGTDQMMVQRLLAARNERESRMALFGSWVVVFLQFTLFLFIGILLFAYYQGRRFPLNDAIFPTFIVDHFPRVLAGIVLAAILAAAMSNLSAAFNSLASTTIMDFYKPWLVPGRDEKHYLLASRLATLGWGGVMIGIALLVAGGRKSVLELGLSIASVAYGSLLGTFLLGVLTRAASQNGCIVGMLTGLGVMIYVSTATSIFWTWYVLIGTTVTFSAGYLASLLLPERKEA